MLKVENSATKKIRVAQIVLFLIEIFLTTEPYFMNSSLMLANSKGSVTAFELITYIGTTPELTRLGVLFLIFIILPVIAVGFQIFDRKYNLKNIVGLICSGLAIVAFSYIVAPLGNLGYGALFSILLYLVTFFLSVMGIFARILKTK